MCRHPLARKLMALAAALVLGGVFLASGGCRRKAGTAHKAREVAVGETHACAISREGEVFCWGENDQGQLGDGTKTARTRAVLVKGLERPAKAVAVGSRISCAVLDDASVRCWGRLVRRAESQLEPVSADPTKLKDIAELALGQSHGCARTATGLVFCFGDNVHGQLGTGTTKAATEPVQVPGVMSATSIAVGGETSCAAVADGKVFCWGRNDHGQAGGEKGEPRSRAHVVSHLASARQVAVGEDHACAVVAGDAIQCWGSNRFGQLGDGTQGERRVPRSVEGVLAARHVTVGNGFGCAQSTDGTVRCWGKNDRGQLVSGSSDDRAQAGVVAGLFETGRISSGAATTCTVSADGLIRCWGDNRAGQVGDGTRSARPVPVIVKF